MIFYTLYHLLKMIMSIEITIKILVLKQKDKKSIDVKITYFYLVKNEKIFNFFKINLCLNKTIKEINIFVMI